MKPPRPDRIDLGGRRALVCGASAGIGLGIAEALAACGADLHLVARREELLKKTCLRLAGEHHIEAEYSACDFSDRMALARLLDGLPEIDLCIWNTGGPRPSAFAETADEEWSHYFDEHLLAPIRLTRALLPAMERKGFGRFIYLTSIAVREPRPDLVFSNVLRSGLTALCKSLARTEAKRGVRFHTVQPGLTDTERLGELMRQRAARQGREAQAVTAEWLAEVPLGRFGRPADIGALVAFLCSPQADYLNGLNLPVDGGAVRGLP